MTAFAPDHSLQGTPSFFRAPDYPFHTILTTPAAFSPNDFHHVMLNFILQPNLTSTYLLRADVFYDSHNDVSYRPDALHDPALPLSTFCQHMRQDYRPLLIAIPGWSASRTLVRQLIPRNPQLDKPLVQTCHFLQRHLDPHRHHCLVLYLPHITSAGQSPWYHPAVRALAFAYSPTTYPPDTDTGTATVPLATLSLHYSLYHGDSLSTRLERTALNLLKVAHKHAIGASHGYVKRVHHDLLIPQPRFQNTYTRLKAQYAKDFIGAWVEQTDPAKHVFEDLGIAAFLIELWSDMYDLASPPTSQKPPFPGFVDIGCGNGVLVHVLVREGYSGWGFDLRPRKTWRTFDETVSSHLKEYVLVPEALTQPGPAPFLLPTKTSCNPFGLPDKVTLGDSSSHPGTFPHGTFIISNHADELTAWTPLLASLSHSPFIAIPCCSHDLAGSRFRAPMYSKARKPHRQSDQGHESSDYQPSDSVDSRPRTAPAKKVIPSAYASFCSYVTCLAEEAGYAPQKEMLRIPSTRNAAIVGRMAASNDLGAASEQARRDAMQRVHGILERELGRPLEQIRQEWLERAHKIAGQQSQGH